VLNLKSDTDPRWLAHALAHLDEILVDHALCEHKAAITALAFVSKYPDDTELVLKLSALATEESSHLERMARVCADRGLTLGHPGKDPYVQGLLALTRPGQLEHRIDRLLICAIIEARSCERLKLLSENLDDEELGALYRELWQAEAGHHTLFVELAAKAWGRGKVLDDTAALRVVKERLDEMAEAEAKLLDELPIRAAIH